jgi:S1-C subfamily serine protease
LIGLTALVVLELALLLWSAAPGVWGSMAGLAPVLQTVRPAVVTLRVTGEKAIPVELKPRLLNGELDQARALEKEVFGTGGSGVIVDSKLGYILTNNHVVENATSIDVGLFDGRHLAGRVVGRDVGTDLAVLRIEPTALPSIVMGNSDTARVGDVVVTVGSPFGLEGTATMGIISAMMRTEIGYEAFEDYLQIDARINRGSSGGALANVKGQLIGINTVMAGGKGQGLNITFAIPINMARIIESEIIAHGSMRRGFTGIVVKDLQREVVSSVSTGAVVDRVVPNTPAAFLGIKPGDVIVQVANKPVRNAAEYMTRVSMIPIGTKLSLLIYSEGRRKRVSLNVAAIALEPERIVLRPHMGTISDVVVGDILPGNALYGHVRGAQILDLPPTSVSYLAGLEKGDVIVAIDGDGVVSVDDLVRKIDKAGLQYRLDIIRDGVPAWVRMSR